MKTKFYSNIFSTFFANPEFAAQVLHNAEIDVVEKGYLSLGTEVGIEFRIMNKGEMAAMLYLLCSKEASNGPDYYGEYIASVAVTKFLNIDEISGIVGIAAARGIAEFKFDMIPMIADVIIGKEVNN